MTAPFSCNLCEALCGMLVSVEDGRVTGVRPDPQDVLSRGHICPKGPALRELFDDPDRLRTPVRRTASGWQPIGWDEALDEVAGRLRAIQAAHGRDAVGLYVGNPVVHSHRAAMGAQALSMALRSRNRFDANSQDSNPRLFACMQVYGDGLAMPVPDVDRTEYLLILGANPAASSGSQMGLGDVRKRLQNIRRRGGRIVLVDPRRTETAALCDAHHFIRPGGDAALLLGMLHVLFDERLVDRAALAGVAGGLDRLRALCARFPPERVAPATGMDPALVRGLARDLAASRRACVYGRVGTCQNRFGPLVSWLIEAVNVVTGHFDREGGAMFPSPAADVGRLARWLVGNHHGRWRSRVRGLPEFLGALPSAVMAEEMEVPGPGQVRAFVSVAGNPVLSTPGGERLGRALSRLEFMAAIDFYVNETTRHAHVILPPAHVFTTGNYDLILLGLTVRNVAKYSAPVLAREAGARDDWEVLSDLALRLAVPRRLRGALLRRLRELPERAVDLLLRLGPYRLDLARLRQSPHGVDLGPLRPCRGERVRTEDGLVCLAPEALLADVPRLERWIDGGYGVSAGDLLLIGRRHLRSNNSWMHNLHSLVKGPDRAHLLMHPDDAARRGLADGVAVQVRSRSGAVVARVAVSAEVMPGVVSLPHGYGRVNYNALTDDQGIEPVLGTSILNGVPVDVQRAGGA